MHWNEIEKLFNRAVAHSFSKRKWCLVFPVLLLCGLLAVICRAIVPAAGHWVRMSLAFLPVFLCSGILLAVGIILTRIYHNEVKGIQATYRSVIVSSKNLLLGAAYLAVPILFAYLILWIILGLFYLVQAIPVIGEFVGAILSFGPLLLVLGSLFLGGVSLLILFYVAPAAALRADMTRRLGFFLLSLLKKNPFRSLIMPLFGLLPLFIVLGLLVVAAVVTQALYLGAAGGGAFVAVKWFFMMIPFCALLAPAVIFFFNFAAESYSAFRKSVQTRGEG